MVNETESERVNCVKCGKSIPLLEFQDKEKVKCICGHTNKLTDGLDGSYLCTHDSVECWVQTNNKKIFKRNQFTGELEEVSSTVKETFYCDAETSCKSCGSIDHGDLLYDKPFNWKPQKPIWEVEIVETEIKRYTWVVMADNEKEARENALNGIDGKIHHEKHVETIQREISEVKKIK